MGQRRTLRYAPAVLLVHAGDDTLRDPDPGARHDLLLQQQGRGRVWVSEPCRGRRLLIVGAACVLLAPRK